MRGTVPAAEYTCRRHLVAESLQRRGVDDALVVPACMILFHCLMAPILFVLCSKSQGLEQWRNRDASSLCWGHVSPQAHGTSILCYDGLSSRGMSSHQH